MTVTVNVYEAKARLSELLALAEAGEEVIVARNGKPVVRFDLVFPPEKRELGFLKIALPPDDFWDPLSDEELALWEGNGEWRT